MEIYLDNAATTRCYDSVADVMRQALLYDYGNPSSLHEKGFGAERVIKDSAKVLADILKVSEDEIYFTSGGTESDNLAIEGCARAAIRSGKHIITSSVEHPAVTETARHLEKEGFRVSYIPVDRYGILDLDALKEAICDDTVLVSVMHVNNEIGSVQPIEEISRIVKGRCPDILFHVDAVQSFCKYRVFPKRAGIDLLSVSGHKIHGPKGVGALYVDSRVKCRPLIHGGGQQKGLRSGTENVPGIAGLAEAAARSYTDLEEKTAKMRRLKNYFIGRVLQIPDTKAHGYKEGCDAPGIVSVGFAGVPAETLLHALEERGIYVSSGSACSSHHPGVSAVLKAIKAEDKYLKSTLRFSLSEFTTKQDLDTTLDALAECVPALRRYRRY